MQLQHVSSWLGILIVPAWREHCILAVVGRWGTGLLAFAACLPACPALPCLTNISLLSFTRVPQNFHLPTVFKLLLSMCNCCRHVRTDAQVQAAVVPHHIALVTAPFPAALHLLLTHHLQVVFLEDPNPVLTTKRWVEPDDELQMFAVRQ